MFSVVIIITFATQQNRQAIQRHCLRLTYFATKPAVPELMKAPSVMSDEISCCRSVSRFHPRAVWGASWPKIWGKETKGQHNMTLHFGSFELRRRTWRKPFMACRPPMRPKSTPYWNGQRTMTPQATKHFQWAFHDSSPFDAMLRNRRSDSLLVGGVSTLEERSGGCDRDFGVAQSRCKTARTRARRRKLPATFPV